MRAVASTVNLVREQFPAAKPNLRPWRDDAQTRRDRIGYMPFYYIYEIRSADEAIATNKNLTTNMNKLVELDQSTVLATTVFDIDEVIQRIMVYFVMATFPGESAFEHAFDYKNILTQWRTDTNPSLEAFIYADRETRKRVDFLMEEQTDAFSTWEQAFLHVLKGGENERLRDRALIIAGTQAKPIPIVDGSPTYQAPVAQSATVTSDGHEIPNAAGTGPAHMRTPERGTRTGDLTSIRPTKQRLSPR